MGKPIKSRDFESKSCDIPAPQAEVNQAAQPDSLATILNGKSPPCLADYGPYRESKARIRRQPIGVPCYRPIARPPFSPIQRTLACSVPNFTFLYQIAWAGIKHPPLTDPISKDKTSYA